MTRLVTLMFLAFAVLSLGTAPVVHAAEQVICVEGTETAHIDVDQSGGDSPETDKTVQHQHGGCHGHHCASLTAGSATASLVRAAGLRITGPASVLAASAPDPALRPPQA
ncbi:hypothetical protein [Sphingomonas sp. LT1P40]|uniref:hypothetical protein n=1 Tax=Alteristakelama amylovorans TaxID=3096166 RepID=UPI002FC7C8CD